MSDSSTRLLVNAAMRGGHALMAMWMVSVTFGAQADVTTDPCCSVVELRQYALHPGQRERFTQLFEGTFVEPQDATGMTVIGEYWDLDRADRFVWLRGFQNMDARAEELTDFYDTDIWRSHRAAANASIADSENVLLLEPASPARAFKKIPARPAAGGFAPAGLIVVTLYYTSPDKLSQFKTFFDRSLRQRAETIGAQTVALYATSKQPNNFPRLAVRTGEPILVWVARFASPEAYVAYETKRDADNRWAKTLWPKAKAQLTRDPEILRLVPTPRSRLRGMGAAAQSR